MATAKTMVLVTSNWHGKPTFRLIPISNDCVFSEGIYDPNDKTLVLISKNTRESLHLVPKLDNKGDVIPSKKPRPNGKPYEEERVFLTTFNEYYVTKREEIVAFVKRLADNAANFDFEFFMNQEDEVKQPVSSDEKTGVLTPVE